MASFIEHKYLIMVELLKFYFKYFKKYYSNIKLF